MIGGLRSQIVIATNVGLGWADGSVFRDATRGHVLREIEDSSQRLQTDYINIYQVCWPDPLVAIEETADAMHALLQRRKIRAIGLSIFSGEQTRRFLEVAPSPDHGNRA